MIIARYSTKKTGESMSKEKEEGNEVGEITSMPMLRNNSSCKIEVTEILTTISAELDPCDDFYQYVCDGWLKAHSSEPTSVLNEEKKKSISSVIEKLRNANAPTGNETAFEKAARLFQSCVAFVDIGGRFERDLKDDIIDFLSDHGASLAPQSAMNAAHIMLHFSFNYRLPTLFTTKIKTRLNSFSMEGNFSYMRLYMLPYFNRSELLTVDAIREHLTWLGLSYQSKSQLVTNIKSVDDFLSNIGKNSAGDYRPGEKNMVLYPLKEFENRITSKGDEAWNRYLNHTTYGLLPGRYYVMLPRYLESFLIHVYRKVNNYALGIWISFQVSRQLRQMVSNSSTTERQEHCWNLTTQAVRTAAYYVHYCSAVANTTISQAQDMVRRIEDSLRSKIAQSTWLDHETKRIALNKLSRMRKVVGYPECAKNKELLNKFYESLNIEESSFVKDWLKALNFETLRLLRWHAGQLSTLDISGDLLAAQGFYYPYINTMSLNVNLLASPFFGVSPAIDYAAAGHFAGHEMMHAYDVLSWRRDDNNVEREWWSNESNAEYERRVVHVRTFYKPGESYSERPDDWNDSELLADFGALPAVYAAYLKAKDLSGNALEMNGFHGFTSDRLFFISSCYKFCSILQPSDRYPKFRARCNVPLKHMAEFSAAFGCSNGTAMNPSKKFSFW
ncbi:membrane metallo-endopeptidase-like 1 [Dermacentor silvarum]|uniref:membrane metallo-endopeptidase-like 1 n=1 Tax=Dermacentor silvarum TaxID=543639 RepID=UPI00210121A7|nr:membrane metallo-endopeptidase-like 1 [Dermacentor silvarum]XP_049527827.1 membrane metallo-endopeptidase-like 1 [Dermacentor silvarum]